MQKLFFKLSAQKLQQKSLKVRTKNHRKFQQKSSKVQRLDSSNLSIIIKKIKVLHGLTGYFQLLITEAFWTVLCNNIRWKKAKGLVQNEVTNGLNG